jgi:hypothetical protein
MAEVRLPVPVRAILSEDVDDDMRAGAFGFYVHADSGPNVMRGLIYRCPCGCGTLHSLAFPPRSADDVKYDRGVWNWNGNREVPTLTPSILSHEGGDRNGPTHWHGFLTAGFFTQA